MHVHVVFQLAVLPGTRSEDIRRIGTHPHAWAQCRGWVEETFPGAIHVPATSTAAAAELLSDGDASFDAALCNAVSVNTYGLEALFTDVADNPGAITRFVLVARGGQLPTEFFTNAGGRSGDQRCSHGGSVAPRGPGSTKPGRSHAVSRECAPAHRVNGFESGIRLRLRRARPG